MSFFYLSAVKGDMPVHLLETILVKRLEFLKALLKGDTTTYNEYLIEGSIYDNVGHFMLCVVTILGEETGFSQFVLKAEVELFKRRLTSLTAYDIRTFAKKLLRNIKKQDYNHSLTEPLRVLCQHLILKDVAQHLCNTHQSKCDKYTLKMNFRHCLTLIAQRQVELKNGTALIPCGKWRQFLTILFSKNIKNRICKTDLVNLKGDPRLMELLSKIRKEFFPHRVRSASVILSGQVDDRSKHFPPCMLNLHLSLRKKHRLSHSQRFYYSLFLKDIGMPVEEAVDFWRAEYKQSPNGKHSCCHNWERDEKKYLYGIRHSYGLEGCKKNYASVNCQRIQSIDNACSEGGCPFKSFDNSKLLPLIKNIDNDFLMQINEMGLQNQYTKMCALYLKRYNKTVDCDSISFNFTPVKYYMEATKRLVDL